MTKLDLYGSSWTRGYDSYLLDKAHRRARVTQISETTQGLEDAMSGAFNEAGLFHHLDSTLPLSRISVRRHGPDAAWADLYYRRTRRGEFLPDPSIPAQLMARFRLSNEWTECYRTTTTVTGDDGGEPIVTEDVYSPNGFPGGDFLLFEGGSTDDIFDHDAEPVSWMWSRPKVAIIVPTFLSVNPLPNALQYVQTLNAQPVILGGAHFDTGTVMFHGADVEWRRHPGGNRYFIDYRFTAVQGGFRKQYAMFNSFGDPPYWYTVEPFIFKKAWGPGTFPAHL